MDFWNAVAARVPMAIIVAPDAYPRIMAETFRTATGLVFLDCGYLDAVGLHPFHAVDGDVSGSGPWKIGAMEIVEIQDGDEVATDWNAWTAFLATPLGKAYSREVAREILVEARLLPA